MVKKMENQHVTNEVNELVECRRIARQECNWSKADLIRKELDVLGWLVVDEAGGKTSLISKSAQKISNQIAEQNKKDEQIKKRNERNKITKLNHSLNSNVSEDGAIDPFGHISSGRQRKQMRLRYRRQAKKIRCPEFAKFLISTFHLRKNEGEDDAYSSMNQCGVLDIAGGHGDLAWALCVTHGINTTVFILLLFIDTFSSF